MSDSLQALQRLRNILSQHANRDRAEAMSAYMKNRFIFFGISKPDRAELTKTLVKELAADPALSTEDFVQMLWSEPERELHYVALEFLEKRKYYREENAHVLYEWLITHQSWWDTVDTLASNHCGPYLRNHKKTKEITAIWRDSNDFWLNRTAIIYQLFYRDDTDFEWMKICIEPHRASKEFFLRKAIGWSLRQYSRYNPEGVKAYVKSTPLSPLSQREALRLMKD